MLLSLNVAGIVLSGADVGGFFGWFCIHCACCVYMYSRIISELIDFVDLGYFLK